MTPDPTEQLIRDAFAAEAERAVDSRVVIAELERRRSRSSRQRTMTLLAVTTAVAFAAAAAVVIPKVLLSGNSGSSGNAVTAADGAPSAPVDQNVLLVGMDDNGNADSVVLAHLGKDGTGSVVSLPRDSWIDIPGRGMGKLSTAYAKTRQDALAKGSTPAEADEAGTRALTAVVRGLTGVEINHYAIVNMAGFDRLSTAVGGVPVCLRSAVRDPYSGATFPAGQQTVSGPTALAFLRQRHGLPYGDLDRIIRLQAFLRSLAHELLSGKTLSDERAVATLLDVVRKDVRVDPGWNLLDFVAQLRGLRVDGLRIGTIPVTSPNLRTAEGDAIGIAPDQVRAFVRAMIAGTPATDQPAQPRTLPPGDVPCVN